MSNPLFLRAFPSLVFVFTSVTSVLMLAPTCVSAAITHGYASLDHPNGFNISSDVMDWTSTPDVLGSDSILLGGEIHAGEEVFVSSITVQWAATSSIQAAAFLISYVSLDSTRTALAARTTYSAMISDRQEQPAGISVRDFVPELYNPSPLVQGYEIEYEIHATYPGNPSQNIPEPSSFILISLAAGIGIHRRKRRKRQIG